MKNLLSILLLVVLVIVFASCKNNKEETKETNIANTEVVTETETQVQTEKETQTPTEPPLSNEEILERGMWVIYSPQDVVFDVYTLEDGVAIKEGYSYSNGTVKKYLDDIYITYDIKEDQVVLINDGGYEIIWEFTDTPDLLTYSWEYFAGPEKGPVVTQKVYHHESLPTYEEAVEEKENMWVK